MRDAIQGFSHFVQDSTVNLFSENLTIPSVKPFALCFAVSTSEIFLKAWLSLNDSGKSKDTTRDTSTPS